MNTNTVRTTGKSIKDYLVAKSLFQVRESSIAGAGDGVFLLRSVPTLTIVSYFHGIRLKEKDIFDEEVR